jgi:hypothetical protein
MATIALARPWQQYLRISLRGLILLVLVLGSALGWIVNRAKVQRDAVAAIERTGGSVKYQWEWKDEGPNSSGKPKWPIWMLDHIGPNLAHIAGVNVAPGGSDEQMLAVGKLKNLETLVVHKSSITAAGLAPLTGLADLRSKANSKLSTLVLTGTNVTDGGVLRLQQALPKLKVVR